MRGRLSNAELEENTRPESTQEIVGLWNRQSTKASQRPLPTDKCLKSIQPNASAVSVAGGRKGREGEQIRSAANPKHVLSALGFLLLFRSPLELFPRKGERNDV